MIAGQVGDRVDLGEKWIERGEAKRVARRGVDPLLPHADRFRLVGIGRQLAFLGTRLRQDGEELVGGQIIELGERPVRRLVLRNLGLVEPAAVRESVEILARADPEIHVCDVDPESGVLGQRHAGRDGGREEQQSGQDDRPE